MQGFKKASLLLVANEVALTMLFFGFHPVHATTPDISKLLPQPSLEQRTQTALAMLPPSIIISRQEEPECKDGDGDGECDENPSQE